MGHGASTENEHHHQPEGQRYFCHACNRGFITRGSPDECIICGSSFIEEMARSSSGSGRGYHLNEDQARRLTSAAALLQLLELQLREELDALRTTLANEQQQQAEKNLPLTQVMKDRLRLMKLNVEMMCEQPSCPICSDDYTLAEEIVRLPCAHLFHHPCVMPWLESKKTCPICRFEFKNELPTTEELNSFTSEELKSRIHNHVEIDDSVMEHETRQELVKRYSEIITNELTLAVNEEDLDASTSQELASMNNRFQQRPASLSEFLRVHGVPHTVLSNGASPGVASDPRSLVNHHIMMSQHSTPSNRGILRQLQHDSDLADQDDEDSSSNGSSASNQRISYRVIANPSIRFIPTGNGSGGGGGSGEGNRPRMIQFRSSQGDNDSENVTGRNSVRVISYPRSRNHESRNESSTPVTYILRHVPNSNGSGYVPVAVQHRIIPVSDEDSDDGL